jgi:hypothetical protein
MRSSVLLLLMLWMVLAPAVPTKAQPTAWMDITVYVNTDTPIYLPVSLNVPYMLQLVDPSSGTINILYPNRMLNISSQQLVTIGSYAVDGIQNKITFWTGINVTAAGNYTFNFRLIYDSTLMANNTVDTSLHVYGTTPWVYRVPITIANNLTSSLTNYQIGLYLDLSAQVSAGKIRSDLGDLRFNDSSENALSYWIENAAASAARIWVKVPSIPASPSTTTIYMYYGNPSATSQSNGGNTFVMFQDFEGTSLPSGWVDDNGISGTVSVANSLLTIDAGTSSTLHRGVWDGQQGVNLAFEVKWRIEAWYDTTYGQSAIAFSQSYPFPSTGSQDSQFIFATQDSKQVRHQSKVGTTWGTEDIIWTSLPTLNTWYRVKIEKTSTAISWYIYEYPDILRGSLINNTDPPQGFTNLYVGLTARGAKASFDWIFVRNYASPEPTYSVGSEQPLVNYAYSVSYGQLSTESQLTVRIPEFSPMQTFTANVSGTYTAPTPLPDAIKIIYNMEYGRYALALLPILFMLVAGKHYAGIMGILACGMSALINVTVGVALFDWTVLGIIAFVCILLIFTEGG